MKDKGDPVQKVEILDRAESIDYSSIAKGGKVESPGIKIQKDKAKGTR